ncbi:hypothetical protein [Streptomyces albireticuli]|uniref:hypothetical protein n=1 Tax=Streptomyces albireticuli TaxID=1940 RepID=UPI0036A8C54D
MTQTPGAGMTSFDEIYDRPDPRGYFQALGPWEYQTPHHAQDVFRRLAAACGGPAATVVDLCCSYGANAALLNHDVTLADLYARYTSAAAAGLTTAELIEADRAFYAERRRSGASRTVGLDIAANAVRYARAVGLLDAGFAVNLETTPPDPELRRELRGTRLLTVTGGASFLTGRSLGAVLDHADGPVWVAAFVLRTYPYRPVASALAARGLRTEKLTTRTFPQRRFTGPDEQRYAVEAVAAAREDPRGRETEGWFHTALYVSRPTAEAEAEPLAKLLA